MSSETDASMSHMESPPLFNYLREHIAIEDMRDYASPRRIRSIDFIKGFVNPSKFLITSRRKPSILNSL